jgi:CDP-diacylglycerol--glycerol-3-phosphate 3-phosphatidyltransferase
MKNMLTLSNTISLLRGPLAFLFLFQSVQIRVFAIVAAMISDCIDGYLARKFKNETFLGKVLDPLMDKFFVYFVMGALIVSGTLSTFGLFSFLIRDVSIILYILTTLILYGKKGFVVYPPLCSKITTALQFVIIFTMVLGYKPPIFIYTIFFALAPIIYTELLLRTIAQNKRLS